MGAAAAGKQARQQWRSEQLTYSEIRTIRIHFRQSLHYMFVWEEKVMRNLLIAASFLLIALASAFLTPAAAQDMRETIRFCEGGAFSTEEDFIAKNEFVGANPYFVGADPYVSDGDLLSLSGQVCARNRDLVEPGFDVSVDVGLDAVHIVDFGEFGDPLIAFSTELDSPHGNFSAGDLLFTNGAVVPNIALMQRFQISNDVGLDGLEIFGKPEQIVEFANNLPPRDDPAWSTGILQDDLLRKYEIEIWFSIEGTAISGEKEIILDGDIISADGSFIARNGDLLPLDVPAGIPDRGVDFGLDAIAVVTNPETGEREILYSTELLFDGERSFTDGDVLRQGDDIVITNDALIAAFNPRAKFLGLDALWLPGRPELQPTITSMCERDANNFNGGVVPAGDPGAYTGLWRANYHTSPPGDDPRRPCGLYVPIDGPRAPLSTMSRFRVAYRPAGTALPAVGAAPGIETRWYIPRGHWEVRPIIGWQWICPEVIPADPATYQLLETSGAGEWMDASDFLDAESGALGCTPVELRFAVWNSASVPPSDPAFDPDGHYIVWLEWEDGSGLHRENADHHIQLDNTAPAIPPYPDGLQVRLMDGETIVPACGETAGESEFQVWGQFYDQHYWYFTLGLFGGNPPNSWSSAHNYYDVDDGTPGVKNTNETGTTPPGQLVHLRDLDMTVLGKSFESGPCCYYLEMYVYDAAILHSFNGTTIAQYSLPHRSGPAFVTFSAAP